MIQIDQKLCDKCGTCAGVCPVNVITISRTQISINHKECIDCRRCTWVCPVHALTSKEESGVTQ